MSAPSPFSPLSLPCPLRPLNLTPLIPLMPLIGLSPLISFLRAKSDVSFPMIIQEFPEQKNILIDLSNDQNLISPDEGLKFIKQAVDYIERNQGDNLLEKLKIKYEKNELDSKEKIELKKLLTSKFEQLTEDELSLFKKL